jgi:hypothetical protein
MISVLRPLNDGGPGRRIPRISQSLAPVAFGVPSNGVGRGKDSDVRKSSIVKDKVLADECISSFSSPPPIPETVLGLIVNTYGFWQ